jgi:peroxiredoxin
MKKWLFIASLIIIIATSIYSVKNYENKLLNKTQTTPYAELSKQQEETSNTSQKGSTVVNPNSQKTSAIDFKLKDLDGNEVSLSQFKGKRVFLNFWATWCGPCIKEMPEIENVFNETKDSDIVILTVNFGESHNTVKTFMDKNNYHFKVLLDSEENVAAKYNIASIPTSYFIDKDGTIVSMQSGPMNKLQMDTRIKDIEKK